MGLSFCGMILRKLTKGQSIFSSLPNPEVRLTCTSTMFLGCSWCLGLVLQNTFHLNFRPFEVKDIFTGHNRTSWPEDLINFSISLRNYFLKSQFKNLRIFELLGIEKKKNHMLNQYLLSINSWEWFLVFFIFFEFSFLKRSQTWVLLDHLFSGCFPVKDFKQSKISTQNIRWWTFERDEEET